MTVSRGTLTVAVTLGAVALAAVVMIASSLRRPEVQTFSPTPPWPIDVGVERVGPVTYTVDASDPIRWSFFDFSRGSVVEAPDPQGWDLAFRRFSIIVNGGPRFAGDGGALDLGVLSLDTLSRVPTEGYHPTEVRRDSLNAAFQGWYRYGFSSHLLTPRSHVFAVRTSDGRYAALELLSYYCPGAQPGCVTFRYVYQGAGGPELGQDAPVTITGGAPPPHVPQTAAPP